MDSSIYTLGARGGESLSIFAGEWWRYLYTKLQTPVLIKAAPLCCFCSTAAVCGAIPACRESLSVIACRNRGLRLDSTLVRFSLLWSGTVVLAVCPLVVSMLFPTLLESLHLRQLVSGLRAGRCPSMKQ